MGSNKMDSSAVYALFEELKHKIEKLDKNAIPDDQTDSIVNSEELILLIEELKVKLNQPQFSKRQIENLGQIAANSINMINANFSKAITEIKSAIKPIDEKINQIKSQQNVVVRKEHVFSIDFQNSKAAITMISMGLVILLSLGGNIWQLNRNDQLKDNDLKYRYIKSVKGITPANLQKLEKLFEFPRDNKRIEEIQKKVDEYEREVQKAAEEIERNQLKTQNKN
jgi:hypothetical protein